MFLIYIIHTAYRLGGRRNELLAEFYPKLYLRVRKVYWIMAILFAIANVVGLLLCNFGSE